MERGGFGRGRGGGPGGGGHHMPPSKKPCKWIN